MFHMKVVDLRELYVICHVLILLYEEPFFTNFIKLISSFM